MSERERFWGRQAVLLACVGMLSLATVTVGVAQTDTYRDLSSAASAPFIDGCDITPNDTLATFRANHTTFQTTRGLWFDVGGTVSVVTKGGTTLSFTVGDASLLPGRFIQVKSTGTTATGIKGLW